MHGCNPRCSVLSDISQETQFVFVVARTEVKACFFAKFLPRLFFLLSGEQYNTCSFVLI